MSRFKSEYQKLLSLVPPEKLVVSAFFNWASNLCLAPMQVLTSLAVHEISERVPNEFLIVLAVAILGLAIPISISAEMRALDEKSYSSSLLSTAFRVTKLESFHIALGGQFLSFITLITANPMMPRNYSRLTSEGDFGPLLENTVSVVAVLAAWKVITNRLILRHDTEVLKNKVVNLRTKIRKMFKAESDDFSLLP